MSTIPPPSDGRVSIRTKWILSLITIGVLPVVALAFIYQRNLKLGLEATEASLEVSVVNQISDQVGLQLGEAARSSHLIGQLVTEKSLIDKDAKIALLNDTLKQSVALTYVGIYTNEGKFIDAVASTGERVPPPPKVIPPEAMQAKRPEQGLWLKPALERGEIHLYFAERIQRDGKPRAWVLGMVQGEYLEETLTKASRTQLGYAKGTVAVSQDMQLLGGGAYKVGESLKGKELFQALKINPGDFRKRYLKSTPFRSKDGTAMVGTVRSLPEFGWALVAARPESLAYADLAVARKQGLIATAIAAILALAAGLLLGRRATAPIRLLMNQVRAYAQRKFATPSEVRTNDELQSLGASLQAMANDIASGEEEIERRATVEANLSRYVPGEVAEAVARGEQRMELGGERRQVSVLFADVTNFTAFAESAPPESVVSFLNELFSVLTEVVFRHNGTVDKFLGDCLMAVFGAPSAMDDHAQAALAAAEDMHRFVEASAPSWREKYGVQVKLAIGLASGEALVGNLGSESRMEYTAIGDMVNVAARLENLAAPGQTLTTSETAKLVGDEFEFQSQGLHPLRGKSQAVEVLQPLD